MGNRLTKNPIVIDTTDQAISGPLAITAMAWVSTKENGKDIAADDDLTLKAGNTAGQVLFARRAEAADDDFVISFPKSWKVPEGLFVEDIDGGELHIWVE